MYEVFLNDRSMRLYDAQELSPLEEGSDFIRVNDRPSLQAVITRFLQEDHPLCISGDQEWMWKAFQNSFRLLPAAGGVVHSSAGILFIFRRGKWDLPKGKIDEGETAAEAALREVREETGIKNLSITGELCTSWHIYQSPYKSSLGQWILKETKWYSMAASGDEPLVPETGEDIDVARWIRPENLDEVLALTYASLVNLIKSLKEQL